MWLCDLSGNTMQAGCEFTNCEGTDDHSLFPIENYDAILFHGNSLGSGFKVGGYHSFWYSLTHLWLTGSAQKVFETALHLLQSWSNHSCTTLLVRINASEMLVAPRISEYSLKFIKLEIWKILEFWIFWNIWKILEHLKNLEQFIKFEICLENSGKFFGKF